jgi:hypothetical protein
MAIWKRILVSPLAWRARALLFLVRPEAYQVSSVAARLREFTLVKTDSRASDLNIACFGSRSRSQFSIIGLRVYVDRRY